MIYKESLAKEFSLKDMPVVLALPTLYMILHKTCASPALMINLLSINLILVLIKITAILRASILIDILWLPTNANTANRISSLIVRPKVVSLAPVE